MYIELCAMSCNLGKRDLEASVYTVFYPMENVIHEAF